MARCPAPASAAAIAVLLSAMASPSPAGDRETIQSAVRWAAPILDSDCHWSTAPDAVLAASSVHEIRFRSPGQGQDEPDRIFRLVRLACGSAAGKPASVFLESGAEGFRLLAFAEPKAEFDYADENFAALKAPPVISGFVTRMRLPGARFDGASNSIVMHAPWRPEGDASSSGVWRFSDGDFVLVSYMIDPSYDFENTAKSSEIRRSGEAWSVYPRITRTDR